MTKKEKQTTYVERDVSWMYFNHRILQEAEKPTVPNAIARPYARH